MLWRHSLPSPAQGQQGLDNSLDQTFNSSTVKTKPELIAISTISVGDLAWLTSNESWELSFFFGGG